MKNIIESKHFKTNGQGFYEITDDVNSWVLNKKCNKGQFNLFIQHTSASLIIMENASPEVLNDIDAYFKKNIPEDSSLYEHSYEGNDDMPAHLKYMLTQTSLTIPMDQGKLLLGTWQGIFLYEHRYNQHTRKIIFSFTGD